MEVRVMDINDMDPMAMDMVKVTIAQENESNILKMT
jgi:hypothetical protein